MNEMELDEQLFEGAVSVERGDGWLRPWRLPCDRLPLFMSPGDGLVSRAEECSGVRLRFETDSSRVVLNFLPMNVPPATGRRVLDLTVDGAIVSSVDVEEGAESASFEGLPAGEKTVEVWLPHDAPMALTAVRIDDGASWRVTEDARPKWVTYGSSLTHCRRAFGSGRTWPAAVAREVGLNVTSLGYGGNCCLEPMVAAMIRDLPADFISLKLGINCISGALHPRTFGAAVMGMVQIIREAKPGVPLALISPMAYPPHETEPNVVGNTIGQMRSDIEEVHRRLTDRGDANLYVFSGMEIFNEEEIAAYTEDQCHPNGEGILLQGRHFVDRVLSAIPLAGAGREF